MNTSIYGGLRIDRKERFMMKFEVSLTRAINQLNFFIF